MTLDAVLTRFVIGFTYTAQAIAAVCALGSIVLTVMAVIGGSWLWALTGVINLLLFAGFFLFAQSLRTHERELAKALGEL